MTTLASKNYQKLAGILSIAISFTKSAGWETKSAPTYEVGAPLFVTMVDQLLAVKVSVSPLLVVMVSCGPST